MCKYILFLARKSSRPVQFQDKNDPQYSWEFTTHCTRTKKTDHLCLFDLARQTRNTILKYDNYYPSVLVKFNILAKQMYSITLFIYLTQTAQHENLLCANRHSLKLCVCQVFMYSLVLTEQKIDSHWTTARKKDLLDSARFICLTPGHTDSLYDHGRNLKESYY